jgi:hypothetical protein
VAQAKKVGTMILQAGVPNDPKARLDLACKHAVTIAKTFKGKVTAPLLNTAFGVIKTRYSLTSIEAFQRGEEWFAKAKINPDKTTPLPMEQSAEEDPAAKAILALIGTKIVVVVPKAAGTLAYAKKIDGYVIDLGSATESPSIKRANRGKGKPELPAVNLDDGGILRLGAKVHQKRSSEADKLKMYRQLESDLSLATSFPEVTEVNVTADTASKIRGGIRQAILNGPKYQALADFNMLISSRKLTGPGMQGELFEAWVVKHFGDAQLISDAKVHYIVSGQKGLMDRSSGDKIVEIKSRVRPNDDAVKLMKDDEIPSTYFRIAGKDTEQFGKYNFAYNDETRIVWIENGRQYCTD